MNWPETNTSGWVQTGKAWDPIRKEYFPVVEYKTRFINESHVPELLELWHTSAIPCGRSARYERLKQTRDWFIDKHPEYSPGGVYKDLECLISGI